MPTSNKYGITPGIEIIEQVNPISIFDIGIGFGKWGFLSREYLEVWKWDKNLYGDPFKFKWSIKIDGAEVFGKYIKELQHNIYDNIYIEDIFTLIDKLDKYDLFILSDVVEHFKKDKGQTLVRKCYEKANKAILIITPIVFFQQGNTCGNKAENHRSLWAMNDFKAYEKVHITYTKGHLIAVISKIDKKFTVQSTYKIHSMLSRFIGFLQSRNITKYGIENYNRGAILKFYLRIRNYRKKLNSC
jgi:hypothetical protein